MLEHLNLTGAPYVFYRDTATGAGTIVYRRYDGRYGVITSDGTTSPSHPAAVATA